MDLWNHGLMFFLSGSYEAAIKCFDAFLKQNPNDTHTLHSKGWALVRLGQHEDAAKCFVKSEKDILSTFLRLVNPDIDKSIEEKRQLAPFLDIMLKEDKFFQSIVKNIQGDIEPYQKAYIKSMLIISLLYVNFKDGEFVAHYTNEKLAEILFLKDSPLRLSLITTSNDPKEGQSLLDYFYLKDGLPIEQTKTIETEFGAFATSFTFNLDHLNQFRLYGRSSDNIEAGGMSFVANQFFFNTTRPNNSNSHESIVEQRSKGGGYYFDKSNKLSRDMIFEDNSKLSLFRCLYIDPDTGFVSSIGQREEYSFYQNEEDKNNLREHQYRLNRILKEIRIEIEELKRTVENLDSEIVSQLLLSLRYLTKHVSFKEEQECRIITVKPLSKAKICPYSGKMYFDYLGMREYIEKIILGAKCFKEQEKIKRDFTDKCLKIVEKVCPNEKNKFVEEINMMFSNKEIEFRNTMEEIGIKKVERSRWLFA